MRPVTWSPEAISDVQGIHDYIEPFNSVAARRIAAELLASTNILKRFPELGKPAAEGRREWGAGKKICHRLSHQHGRNPHPAGLAWGAGPAALAIACGYVAMPMCPHAR